MRKRATAAFLVALLLGLIAVAVGGAATTTTQQQTVGVLPALPVAPIAAGQQVCQRGIALDKPVERVRFNVGTRGKTGPPLDVAVRDTRTGAILGSGAVRPGWVDNGTAQNVAVGHVGGDRLADVCVRNHGPVRAYVFGDRYKGELGTGPVGVRPTNTTTAAAIDGRRISGDIAIWFVSERSHSMLSAVPDMFRRAGLFRPGIVGAWTFWLLLALALLAAPLALWRAIGSALAADGGDASLAAPDGTGTTGGATRAGN